MAAPDAGQKPDKPDPALQQSARDIQHQVDKGDLKGGEQQLSHVFASWVAGHQGQPPQDFWKSIAGPNGLSAETLQKLSLAYADDPHVNARLTTDGSFGTPKLMTAESIERDRQVNSKTEGSFEAVMDTYLQQALSKMPEFNHGIWSGIWSGAGPGQYIDKPTLDKKVDELSAQTEGALRGDQMAQQLMAQRQDKSTLFAQLSTSGTIDKTKVAALQKQVDAGTANGLSDDDKRVVAALNKFYTGGASGSDHDAQALQAAIAGMGGSDMNSKTLTDAAHRQDTRDQAAAQDQRRQYADIFTTYANLSEDTGKKLFQPNGNEIAMTPETVQAALKDTTLSKHDRDVLTRLADPANWPRNKDGTVKPITNSDVLRSFGNRVDDKNQPVNIFTANGKPDGDIDLKKVNAAIEGNNVAVNNMLGALGKDLVPGSPTSIVGPDQTITHDTIQARLAKLDPKDPNAQAEGTALQWLDKNFDMISRNGSTITGADLKVFADNHRVAAQEAPQQPGAGALDADQMKAQDEAWKKIDSTPGGQDQTDRLQHGETLYAFAQRHLGPNADNKQIFTWLNDVMSHSGFQPAHLDPNKSHYTQHDLPRNWNSISYKTDLHIGGGTPQTPEQKHEAREQAGMQTIGNPVDYVQFTQPQLATLQDAWTKSNPGKQMQGPEASQFAAQYAQQHPGFITNEQAQQAMQLFGAAKAAMEARLKAYEDQLAQQAQQPVVRDPYNRDGNTGTPPNRDRTTTPPPPATVPPGRIE
jgi:hypothetical protein